MSQIFNCAISYQKTNFFSQYFPSQKFFQIHKIRAGDWDIKNYIWTGKTIIKSKGDSCNIILEDHDPQKGVFAVCPYHDGLVEPVVDSSRYFILKIENQGKHAFVGVGFAERNHAFDFNSALQDHQRYVRQRKEEKEAVNRLDSLPKKDYSLKEGEKIIVDVRIKKPEGSPGISIMDKFGSTANNTSDMLLPPPPSSAQRGRRQQTQGNQGNQQSPDPFSEFLGSSDTPSVQKNDPWGPSPSTPQKYFASLFYLMIFFA